VKETQASENTGKPSGLSGEKAASSDEAVVEPESQEQETSGLERKIEEAWILWKLNQKGQVESIVIPLLNDNSENIDLLQLAGNLYVDKGDLAKARDLLKKLETISGSENLRVKELKYIILSREGNWPEALKILEALLKDSPTDWALRRDYAQVLTLLNRLPEAKDQYILLYQDTLRRNEITWDFLLAKEAGGDTLNLNFEYLHGPQSLRHYTITEGVSHWLNKRLRFTANLIEEQLRIMPLGDTPGIDKNLQSPLFKAEYFTENGLKFNLNWEFTYLFGRMFNEPAIGVEFNRNNIHSKLAYDYHHLVRDPIQGLDKQGTQDKLTFDNDYTFFDRFILGNLYEVDWYRVKGDENQVNGKPYLGYKIFNDSYLNYIAWRKPYISFNFHCKLTHWNKAFDGAEQVLDYIGDEHIYYGGFYLEHRFGKALEVSASLSRAYDVKRKFYYTLSNIALDFWIRENIKSSLAFEYDNNINGTTGQGNSSIVMSSIKALF